MNSIDPTSLLATDARFLVEDHEHIVLAIRLKKGMIKDNVPLLWEALSTVNAETQNVQS